VEESEALERAQEAIRVRLERSAEWAAEGNYLIGPGTTALVVQPHDGSPLLSGTATRIAHLDVTFILNRDRRSDTSIPDCVSGFGATDFEAIEVAAEQWASGTAQVAYELLTQDGSHATHFGAQDPLGLAGCHVIHGPFQGFGRGQAPDALADWASNFGVLHALSPSLCPAVAGKELTGIRFFFGTNAGEDTAEVRVAGVVDPASSTSLLQLPWPRSAEMAYVRAFALVVHGS
jgi:hypothetical protein